MNYFTHFDMSIITNRVYNWVNESNLDFKLELGEKNLYLVVNWSDGASLFIDDDFSYGFFHGLGNYSLMNELIATYCDLDEDTNEEKVIWFNKLFGIGSEWHGIADDALESQTTDLNKMEKERDI